MALKKILLHPDPHLKKHCAEISCVNADVRRLAEDMLETMYDAPGVGLAAPQVGELQQLFVMDCTAKEDSPDPLVLINPTVVWTSEELHTYNEGCLSIPEQFEDVTRPAAARIQFLDIDGALQEREFDGLWATCAQHEIDHLNGKLFIDYLSTLKRSMITKKMMKFKRELARD